MLYRFEEEGEDTMESINGVDVVDKEELLRELGGDCSKDIQNLVDCLSDDDDNEPSDLALINLGTTESAGKATGAGAANNRKELHDLNTNNNKINGVITAEESSRQSSLVKTKDKRSKVSLQMWQKRKLRPSMRVTLVLIVDLQFTGKCLVIRYGWIHIRELF